MELHSELNADTQDLIWAMLDEQISEPDFKRLETLLGPSDESVRRLYVQCVQIHVDLQRWFGADAESSTLGTTGLPLDLPMPSGDSMLSDPAF